MKQVCAYLLLKVTVCVSATTEQADTATAMSEERRLICMVTLVKQRREKPESGSEVGKRDTVESLSRA